MNSRSAGRRERSKGALVEAQIGGLYEAISAVTSVLSLDAVLQKVADLSRGLVERHTVRWECLDRMGSWSNS